MIIKADAKGTKGVDGGAGWRAGGGQVWLMAFTWLRRQKNRGRRHEKRYLPHRITQEKHQLSRVMLPPESGCPGRAGRERRTGCVA